MCKKCVIGYEDTKKWIPRPILLEKRFMAKKLLFKLEKIQKENKKKIRRAKYEEKMSCKNTIDEASKIQSSITVTKCQISCVLLVLSRLYGSPMVHFKKVPELELKMVRAYGWLQELEKFLQLQPLDFLGNGITVPPFSFTWYGIPYKRILWPETI